MIIIEMKKTGENIMDLSDVKKLGFGFMRLPLLDENDRSQIDMEQVKE